MYRCEYIYIMYVLYIIFVDLATSSCLYGVALGVEGLECDPAALEPLAWIWSFTDRCRYTDRTDWPEQGQCQEISN